MSSSGAPLRRQLRFVEAVALSIAIMSPTLAMSFNGSFAAGHAGRAVPLVFLLATVGVLLVTYGFYRLASYFHSAGSVYAFTGATLGPRAGFFAGWALFGFYFVSVPAAMAGVGVFGSAFLDSTSIWHGDHWFVIALVATVAVVALATQQARAAVRALIGLEGLSVLTIVVLIVVIFAKLIFGGAPQHQGFTLSVFAPSHGVGFSAVMLAVVFGFLSFAGFEGAAALGEETNNPRRDIPRALLTSTIVGGVFFVVCMMAESMGWGTSPAQVNAFASSGSPLGDLASSYVGSAMGDILTAGAALSAFSAGLGIITAGSRMLYAFCRDGNVVKRLAHVSRGSGTPNAAIFVIAACNVVFLVAYHANGTAGANVFLYLATIGTLSLLVAYMLTSVGAISFLFIRNRIARAWEIVIPVAAIVFLGYTLIKQIVPVPPAPLKYFPYIVAAWLLGGLAIVVGVPGMARQMGEALKTDDAHDLVPTKAEAEAELLTGSRV
jgi:amino acid transporter